MLRRIIFAILIALSFSGSVMADKEINHYYIRFDIKSSGHKIHDENFIMVPANQDFRAEKFSRINQSGVISADPGEINEALEKQIKENALKTILARHGLKSVKARDYDTVISYEGMILTPLTIIKNTYIQEKNGYEYEVQVDFSPVSFPDKWESLSLKQKIKDLVNDFFQFFK